MTGKREPRRSYLEWIILATVAACSGLILTGIIIHNGVLIAVPGTVLAVFLILVLIFPRRRR